MRYLDLLTFGSPEAIIVVGALVVLGIGLSRSRATTLPTFIAAIAVVGSLAAVWLLPTNAVLFAGQLVISPFSRFARTICLALCFVTVLLARRDRSLRPHYSEFLAMLLLATVGLMLLVGSEELLTIFIGLELLGLSLYVMTGFEKNDVRGAEAALKYFLFGSTASAFTLFGISVTYGLSGSTVLTEIGHRLASAMPSPLLAIAIVMTLIGFAFKVAAAPFHLWAPDTYQAAPAPTAAFIASASKVGSFVVLAKIVAISFAPLAGSAAWRAMLPGWTPVLAAIAAFSILLGNFGALAQTNLSRLLAYSAVAHAGYTLIGLVSGNQAGLSATFFYITVYALTLVGAFAVIGIIRRKTGGDDLASVTGLASRSPWLAACLTIFILSLAGLPPLPGFFGKFYLFSAAFAGANHTGLLWLVVVALFGSLISLYYYLIVLKLVFLPSSPQSQPGMGSDTIELAVITLLAATVLLLGLMPQLLLGQIASALGT